MSFMFAVAENFLLIVALPWLASDAARALVARLDNRGMFSIPFCQSLAVASGGLLAIATGVLVIRADEFSLAGLLDIFGFWHESRFLFILARFVDDLRLLQQASISGHQWILAQTLLASALLLTALSFGIALSGWRSPGAFRGLLAHCVIALSVWLVVTVGALAALWVLHWLNFWTFLVLLIVLELRRREDAVTRLSF